MLDLPHHIANYTIHSQIESKAMYLIGNIIFESSAMSLLMLARCAYAFFCSFWFPCMLPELVSKHKPFIFGNDDILHEIS